MIDGGPAFPRQSDQTIRGAHGTQCGENGMSLRDYFAAKALPSVIAAYVEANGRCIGTDHVISSTVIAFKFADAMLVERAKEK